MYNGDHDQRELSDNECLMRIMTKDNWAIKNVNENHCQENWAIKNV